MHFLNGQASGAGREVGQIGGQQIEINMAFVHCTKIGVCHRIFLFGAFQLLYLSIL